MLELGALWVGHERAECGEASGSAFADGEAARGELSDGVADFQVVDDWASAIFEVVNCHVLHIAKGLLGVTPSRLFPQAAGGT